MGNISVIISVAIRKRENVTIEINNSSRFTGRDLNFPLFLVRKENNKGKSVYEMITTVVIPRIDTMAMDLISCRC